MEARREWQYRTFDIPGKQYLGQSEKNEVEMFGNMEAVLRECGFEDSPIEKAYEEVTSNQDTQPKKALEVGRV